METAALSFERAWVLQFLWLLPLVAALFWWSERRRRVAIGRIVAPKLRALLAGNASPVRRWFRAGCVLLAMALLISALAGPRLGYDTIEVPHRGRDVVIAMDVSRSMLAPDMAPSRLERAKLLAQELISELEGDRIGLVAFAGSAFLQAPLTLDHGAVLNALDELDTSVIPKGGSNIAEAIRTAEEAFGKAEGFSRAVVVMSDGEELSADAVEAAKQAAASGVKIFAVGVGSSEGSEIPDGAGDFVRDPATGKIVNSKLDERRLREIAEATGGFYVQLGDTAAAKLSAEGIGRMAESDIADNSSRRPIERYQWPLGAAIALLMLQSLVGERRRRTPAAALAVFMLLPAGAHAAPAGLEAYEQGNYEKARDAFESRLRQEEFLADRLPVESEAAKLQFNAGAAAYRLGDYEKAAQYFSQAALSPDAGLRAKADYSFGNTLFRRGAGQQEKEKKISDWKEAIAKYEAAMKSRPDYTEAEENKERVKQLLEQAEKEQKNEEQQKQDKNAQQKQDQQQQQKQDQQQQEQNQDQQDQQQQKDQQEQKKDQQKSEQKSEEQKQGGQGKNEQDEQKTGEEERDQQGGGGSGGQDQQKDQQNGQGGSGEKKEEEQKSGDQSRDQQAGQGQEKNKQQDQPRGAESETSDGQGQKEKEEKRDQPGSSGESSPQSQARQGDESGPVPQQPREKKEGELRGSGAAPGDQPGQSEPVSVGEKVEEGKMSEGQARALLRSLQGEEGKVNLHEQQDLQEVSRDW